MLSRNYLLALVFLVTITSFARATSPTEEGECAEKTTCSKCIGYAKENCVWCSNLKNKQLVHCQNENYSDKNWCADDIEKSHDEITYLPTSDLPKQHIWIEDGANNTPSKGYIQTRVGVPKSLDITYKIGKDFTVDFYFLLDLSVRKGGGKIHYLNEAGWNTIRSLNNDVHIGLGTFIDRPVPPYGSPESDIPEILTNSNIPNYLLGPKPYSYKNIIPLTNKTGDAVGLPDANTKGIKGRSLDDRQGTLDALMQVMVCEGTEGVGWRQEALHIIIVVTDKPYHSAGDGKMAGAGLRNDMQCHMMSHAMSHDPSIATTQDYPSVGQINKVARDKNFIIVFAVDSEVRGTYELLSKTIKGSVVQQTSDLHRDLQAITKNAYEEILKCPQIFIKAPGNIKVTLDPQCNTAVRKQECMITEEESKKIKATVSITECLKGTQNVELQVMGFTSKVVLEVKSSCVCNCMKEKKETPDKKCNNKGDFKCGVCECTNQSLGPDCSECSRNEETCKESATAVICSGRGKCSCGKCLGCLRSSGKFCEFTDDLCDLPDQIPKCSGPDHGFCSEGKCVCHEPYIGKDCSCRNDNSTCVGPNKLVCSGNGDCMCGKCQCILDKITIPNNDYCDYIRCDDYSELAMCLHDTDNPEDCFRKHPLAMEFEYKLVNKSDMAIAQSGRMEQCNMKNINRKGILVFRYKFTEPPFKLVLNIQNELDTPEEPNIPLTVGIAVGTVVMAGMLTAIIWKYTVDFIDAKEYKAFRKELENLEFHETNPLYRDATTKTKNPTFRLSFKFKRNSSLPT